MILAVQTIYGLSSFEWEHTALIVDKVCNCQQFNVNIVPLGCNLIQNETQAQRFSCKFWNTFPPALLVENETPTQVFSSEFCKFFQPVSPLKRVFSTAFFLWILRNFSVSNFIKTKILAQVLFYEFNKIFCEGLLLMIWSLPDFFCKIYCSLKWKIKEYQR